MTLPRPDLAIALLAAALALGACGRKTALDTPVTINQTLPWTPEGRQAMDPPRDAEGRPQRVPSQPGPRPAAQSFPLDFLLN
jgi:hypothetical protein